jgi:hypothetical protein
MQFLFIAVLSLAAWLGPASASAEQVRSPLAVTAVSVWARPATPGTTLDPSDPHVMGLAGSILSFTLVSSGDQYTSQILDSYYTDSLSRSQAKPAPLKR